MEKYLALLQTTPLFAGIPQPELARLLAGLDAHLRRYGRGEAIITAGQPSHSVGVVLTGEICAARPTPDGGAVPIAHMRAGGVFGDVLGGSSLTSPVTVTAQTACEVLMIPYRQLLRPCEGDAAHQAALQNLVRSISDKYFHLSRRVDLLVLKSLRAKICAYLLAEREQAKSPTFTVPFTRIQLAEYLNCDRSALSRELSAMQREGLLDTYKSSFKLLNEPAMRRMVQ